MSQQTRTFILGFTASIAIHMLIGMLLFFPRHLSSADSFISIEFRKGSSQKAERAPTKIERSAIRPPEKSNEVPELRNSQSTSSSVALKGSSDADESPILGSAFGLRIEYPRLSRLMGEEGKVVIEIQKDASGNPGTLKIFLSSGHPRLDEAALTATQDGIGNKRLLDALKSRDHLHIGFIFQLGPEK